MDLVAHASIQPSAPSLFMNECTAPYLLPDAIESELRIVREYWASLKRAGNEMPFWDDVKISALPDLSNQLMLIDVFEGPMRFRFSHVGDDIEGKYGNELRTVFADEIQIRTPLDYLHSQCSATVEGSRPTYYRHAIRNADTRVWYSRLLLPMWGEGHIGMLLGGFAWH
jgi:hypothetical protein